MSKPTAMPVPLRIALMQLPPPLHGMSKANAAMHERLFQPATVTVIDMAVRGGRGRLGYLAGVVAVHLRACWRLLALRLSRGPAGSAYFAFSGGERLWLEVALMHLARGLGARSVFCHHHSYAYLDATHAGLRTITGLRTPEVHHIVQTLDMRDAMTSRYGNVGQRFHLLGNAWIVERYMGQGRVRTPIASGTGLCVGLLSNLAPEKGVLRFLSLARRATRMFPEVRFELAGPCAPEIRLEIERTVADGSVRLRYRDFVDDDAKANWYGQVDLFFFASTYFNEANPLVLLEALAAGCVVVSTDRGAIATTLGSAGVLSDVEHVEDAALSLLADWSTGQRALAVDSNAAIERFRALATEAGVQLANLASEMEGRPAGPS